MVCRPCWEVCLWTNVSVDTFLPTFKGIWKRHFTLPVQHLQTSKSAPQLRSCRGLQTGGTWKLQHRRSRAVCACGWWMVGETASEVTCCMVAWCIYNVLLFLPSFQILPGIWKLTDSPPFPSAEQLQRTKGLESISSNSEGTVNKHWLNYKLKIYHYPEWWMVEGNGLRTCRINLSFLELVKNYLFRNVAAWG